jgi:hypothetical protein
MLPHARRLALSLLLLAVAACAGSGKPRPAMPDEDRTTLRVQNQTFSQATIYVLNITQRIRLGEVGPNGTRVFTIPSDLVGGGRPLRFLADPIGSNRTAPSYELRVVPGDEVNLIIPPGTF